jgi:RHS repeat-associated protein
MSETTRAATPPSLYARQRYYPYGQVRYQWGSLPTTYNFTGQRLDGDTGLLYYGARYYDPALMRFVQADTIVPQPGNPQSLNWNDDTQAW